MSPHSSKSAISQVEISTGRRFNLSHPSPIIWLIAFPLRECLYYLYTVWKIFMCTHIFVCIVHRSIVSMAWNHYTHVFALKHLGKKMCIIHGKICYIIYIYISIYDWFLSMVGSPLRSEVGTSEFLLPRVNVKPNNSEYFDFKIWKLCFQRCPQRVR